MPMAAIGGFLGAGAASAATVGTMATVGALGVGASIYGANKSAKAVDKATQANAQSVADTNALNYKRWLESQGIGENGERLNVWLPRYAKVNSNFGRAPRFRIKGSTTVAPVTSPSSAEPADPFSNYAGAPGGIYALP